MSTESQVGRAIFELKDVVIQRVCARLVEMLNNPDVNADAELQKTLINHTKAEIDKAFSDGVGHVLRSIE